MGSHVYYKLKNGDLIHKSKVDRAMALIESLLDGYDILLLNETEGILCGSKIDAIILYKELYGCGIKEAKAAVEKLRGEINDT